MAVNLHEGIKLEDMVVFARVVEKSSFTAASRDLRKSIGAVSKHVKRLESTLSAKLLHRSTHNLYLTGPGRVFYEHCSRIIAEIEQARAETAGLNQEVKGVLRIHSTPGIGRGLVAPAAIDFTLENCAVTIELTVTEVATSLMRRGVDLMICSRYFGQNQTLHSGLIARDLGHTPYVICASADYFKKHGMPASPQDLRQHNCLVHLTQKRNPDEWHFRTEKGQSVIRIEGTFRSNLESAIVMAANQGVGIARLPYYTVARQLKQGRLKAIFSGAAESDRMVKVFYPRSKFVPRTTHAFIDFLERRLKQTRAPKRNGHEP